MPGKKSKQPPGSIPVRTSIVCAYIFQRRSEGPRFLLLKRKSSYMFGLWQQVAGKVEKGESAVQAILREIKEETGNRPQYLYSADIVETFYDIQHNCLHVVPVFVAELDSKDQVVLSGEHSEFKWVTIDEAKELFSFTQQRLSVDLIGQEFVLKRPARELLIEF
jgi:dATP pyrophosphohydrolase